MFDYIKFCIPPDNHDVVLENLISKNWNTYKKIKLATYELIEYPIKAEKGSMKVEFKSRNFIVVSGSLHKQTQNNQNFREFNYKDFSKALKDLQNELGIDLGNCTVHNLEFGVNVTVPFEIMPFLDKVHSYKGVIFYPFEPQNGISLGIHCHHSQYRIKLYSKTIQYELPIPIMRAEIKALKMQYLKKFKIKCISDLLDKKLWQHLSFHLQTVLSDLVYLDDSIEENILTPSQLVLYKNWLNPTFIKKLQTKNKKMFERQRRNLRSFQVEYSKDKNLVNLVHLVQEKSNNLLLSIPNNDTNFTNLSNKHFKTKMYQSYHSINR